MQPNGNVIVIEAEPINECPTCAARQDHEQVLQGHFRLLRPLHLAVPDPRRQHPTHNQCTLQPEGPLNGGISKHFSQDFTPNRFQTGRLARFGVKCRLFGGERGWRTHQRPPTPANPSQAMVVENVLLHTEPRRNPSELINAL
ncbi:hypothetical protein CIP107521_00064 [Corynebacterium diphtheriae]|nr:hypothetical protein CIP107521_00064 [Corynebacterium diphtheriae]